LKPQFQIPEADESGAVRSVIPQSHIPVVVVLLLVVVVVVDFIVERRFDFVVDGV
jgi:hypothetical protein